MNAGGTQIACHKVSGAERTGFGFERPRRVLVQNFVVYSPPLGAFNKQQRSPIWDHIGQHGCSVQGKRPLFVQV